MASVWACPGDPTDPGDPGDLALRTRRKRCQGKHFSNIPKNYEKFVCFILFHILLFHLRPRAQGVSAQSTLAVQTPGGIEVGSRFGKLWTSMDGTLGIPPTTLKTCQVCPCLRASYWILQSAVCAVMFVQCSLSPPHSHCCFFARVSWPRPSFTWKEPQQFAWRDEMGNEFLFQTCKHVSRSQKNSGSTVQSEISL